MTKPLISYYGDDFTGSTDVMEALASNGIDTVLFLNTPDDAMLARFPSARAVGLAGTSRSETPAWMDSHLSDAFEWLKSLDGALCHYKVCSTFDSGVAIGNIGRAIEIGRAVFGKSIVPLIVGAPQIRRYTAFGQLFAAYQGRNFRIDRHPVMARHPVTPMDEADILKLLARQTSLSSALIDNVGILADDIGIPAKTDILLLDVLDEATQSAAGDLLWSKLRNSGRFVCGSSGVEYALIPAWRKAGLVGQRPIFADAGPVDRIAVVSGSVSPTTERQIRHALANGFGGISLDPVSLATDGAKVEKAIDAGLNALSAGRSVIIYTALGPAADRGGEIDTSTGARHRIGRALGRIQRALVERAGLSRVIVAGGDTSSHALGEMGISALTLKMPLPQTPGSPLCVAHGSKIDGLEIALKGGQVGGDDYFSMILAGRA